MRRLKLAPKLLSLIGSGLLASSLTACGSSPEEDTSSEVTIGLLLPFTGSDSATSSNFERAALYAASRVNGGGGIEGKRLRIVSEDTHSELAGGQRSAQKLIDAGAKLVIGPESAVIAPQLYPIFTRNQVTLLSPLIGAGAEPTFDCSAPWFRLGPSAQAMGQALGRRVLAQKVGPVAIIAADDAYNQALGAAVSKLYLQNGGSVSLELKIDPDAQSYASTVRTALAQGVTSVVLATSARAGALLVNEFDALSTRHVQWFLSPLLKTDLFVTNVAPDALEGALGSAPGIYDTTAAFPDAFAEQWQGDRPLEGAYFYYDAVVLAAFALERAALTHSADLSTFANTVKDVAAPPGEGEAWDDVEVGLGRIRQGDDIYYSGLTGPISFNACGANQIGVSSSFAVKDGRIVNQ